jgi:hypothetical protein
MRVPVVIFFVLLGGFFPGKALAQDPAAGIQASLRGTWQSVCMNLGDGQFIKITMSLDGAGGSNDKTVFYRDAGCSNPTGLVKTNSSVSYQIGSPVTASGKSAHQIDTTINTWQLTQDGAVIKNGGAVPTQYDIVAVEGDKLFTSGLNRANPGMITNPTQRPTTLDTANYYTRHGSP